MKKSRGFTLLELMAVVAIIAILAGLALSQYGKQVRKSKRAEARQAISTIAMAEEKYRMNNATYGTCDQVLAPGTCTSYNTSLQAYTVAITAGSPTATAYTITAAPKTTDQAKDPCGTLSYAMSAGTATKTPTTAGCW